LVTFAITALAIPLSEATATSAAPTVEGVCAGTLVGTIFTLTAGCVTTQPLMVPDGQTVDGNGNTITASGNPFNTTPGQGVLFNGGTTMSVENLTIQGNGFANSSPLVGIFFSNASGNVTNVTVRDMTMGSGAQTGDGIRANATTPQTVNITGSTITGYQKRGVVAFGTVTMNVSNSTIGPPDDLGMVIAQNGVQFQSGAGGSLTGSTITGSSFEPGSTVSTAVLVFAGNGVTVSGNTITGNSDVGIAVVADSITDPMNPIPSTGVTISDNKFENTGPTGSGSTGVLVDSASEAGTALTGNTFAGWDMDLEGIEQASPPVTPPVPPPAPPVENFPGYWLAGADGGAFAFGVAPFHGSAGGLHLNSPVVGIAPGARKGYWLAGADGGVFTFGPPFLGSLGGVHLNAPIVGIAATGDGAGYYLAGADGGVFAFGDARFEGSMGGTHLNAPIVGIAITPDSQGYYLVGADGGVFAFGDARFDGSMGATPLHQPMVGMAVDNATSGYWLVGADGGVFSFGTPFLGSLGGVHLNAPVVGIASSSDDLGYHLVAADGGVFAFGDAAFAGSLAGTPLNKPIAGISTQPAQEPVP